jgi:hypothetical protein
MKYRLAVCLLVLSGTLCGEQQASAEYRLGFQPGFDFGVEGGNNSFFSNIIPMLKSLEKDGINLAPDAPTAPYPPQPTVNAVRPTNPYAPYPAQPTVNAVRPTNPYAPYPAQPSANAVRPTNPYAPYPAVAPMTSPYPQPPAPRPPMPVYQAGYTPYAPTMPWPYSYYPPYYPNYYYYYGAAR